ncbi:MAG: MFS transporter permease, partial [Streptococcus salivarius]|nr:MFS transporter permease [Streptococcus salivarius]
MSLIIEYGYAIALSIIFSKISVDYVLGLWIAKFLGGILANVGHQFVGKITNKKYVLIGIELLKAVCLALIYLAMGSVFVFALVVLTEVLTTYFNSLLSSAVPVLVKKVNLQKFNSTYTMIGSASYFLAPMIVGLWGSLDLGSLFLVYSVLTLLATLLLFKLGPIIFDRENESEEEVSSSQGSPIFGRQSVVLKMVMMTILLQSVGVLY